MNVLFSVMLTLLTAAFKLFEDQYRLPEDRTADESILVCYLRVIVVQLAAGFDVTAKIAWTYAVKGFITWGVSSHQQGNVLFDRTLLLWAVSLTFVFSALTLLLQRWRRCVNWRKKFYADRDGGLDGAAFKAGLDAGLAAGLVAGLIAGLVVGLAVGLAAGLAAGFAAGPLAGLAAGLVVGLNRRALCNNYLLLLEDTLGWVTGCAWTDALVAYTPLGENTIERPWAAAKDLLVAIVFTALGVLWFVSTGQAAAPPKRVQQNSDHARARAEAIFATSAFTFFVGWSWVVVLRAGTALVFDAVELVFVALARLVASLNDSETVSSLNETLDEQEVVFFGFDLGFNHLETIFLYASLIISVILLGPGLTAAALWAGMSHMCRLGSAKARHTGLLEREQLARPRQSHL